MLKTFNELKKSGEKPRQLIECWYTYKMLIFVLTNCKKKKIICITFQFVLPIVFQVVNVLFGLKTKNQKKYRRPVNLSYTVITFAANYEVCRL